ncbi:MAG: 1-acyl-sn-glycerol-3-phosphate acyltransferase [Ruminococcus sp.]|nr:1-acyl-sn-glycerol-3-phosphate acyltransferase [Ruminococcus sp.]
MFDPKTNKFPYPEETDKHYLVVKKNDGTVFDADYPYIDYSKSFLFKQSLVRLVLNILVFPLAKIRLGLKVEGRENLKKYKDVLDKGVVSCSNHVHMWDYIAIMSAIRPHKPYLLSWAPNLRGENKDMIRLTGGIPIPDSTLRATAAYLKAVKKLLDDGGWLQIYSEGSMWEYYRPIRPFKQGAAFFAAEHDKPILPMGFSYREPSWIRKHIFRQIACFTLNIGEPIFRDEALTKKEMKIDLTKRSHEAVCRLAYIDPEENIYPPIFNNSKRIDYYTDTYGVGYKGSR